MLARMNRPQPSNDAIAELAYLKWEREGRPAGRSEEFWLTAERELGEASSDDNKADDGPPDQPGVAGSEVPITDLERALPPKARREARARRRASTPAATSDAGPRMSPPAHYIIVVDRAHLRIYLTDMTDTGRPAAPTLAHALDAPAGRRSYVAEDSDQAGQFPGSRGPRFTQATSAGGANDERLPMQEERDRKLERDWSAQIEDFLGEHATSTWDFAAGPALHRAVLERLSPGARQRLRQALQKDLVNVTPADLRTHFAAPITAH